MQCPSLGTLYPMKRGRHLGVISSPEAVVSRLSLKFSLGLCADLNLIVIGFRRRSTPEDEEEPPEIHTPDKTQSTHALLLPIDPHHRDKNIRDWADGVM